MGAYIPAKHPSELNYFTSILLKQEFLKILSE